MNEQAVNEYIKGLMESNGDKLQGMEKDAFMQFQQSNMDAMRLHQQLSTIKGDKERLLQKERELESAAIKASGVIETTVNLLVSAERARRDTERPTEPAKRPALTKTDEKPVEMSSRVPQDKKTAAHDTKAKGHGKKAPPRSKQKD